MSPPFEVDEMHEKHNAPEGDFLMYKPLDVPIICLPVLLKKKHHVI